MSTIAAERLTEREHAVLALIAQGHSNRAIAQLLRLTERTVESHTSRIFTKLDLAVDTGVHRRVLATLAHQQFAMATERTT